MGNIMSTQRSMRARSMGRDRPALSQTKSKGKEAAESKLSAIIRIRSQGNY